MENTRLILSETADHWPALMIGPPGLPTYAENTLHEPDHRARCASMERICTENAVPYFDILSVFPTLKNWRVEAEGRRCAPRRRRLYRDGCGHFWLACMACIG